MFFRTSREICILIFHISDFASEYNVLAKKKKNNILVCMGLLVDLYRSSIY
jgi:hypothetical protein